jgi:hypothetical protein
MAINKGQEAYELTRAGPALGTTAGASARRPSTASQGLVQNDANSDDPISDDQVKGKEKDGKEQQPGMADYFVGRYFDYVV